jgi:hypothetical protein
VIAFKASVPQEHSPDGAASEELPVPQRAFALTHPAPGVGRDCQRQHVGQATQDWSPPNLLLEHFFDLTNLLLNFAGVFFDVAFGL